MTERQPGVAARSERLTAAGGAGVSRVFVGLCLLDVTCLILSNLVAGKLMSVGGVVLDGGTVLFPLTYILGDVFTEVYGFRNSRFVIWAGFGCNFLAVFVFLVAIWLPHPDFWQHQAAYETVFAITPRVFVASLLGYLVGEFSNSMVLSRLKVLMAGRRLWVRTIASTVVGEGLDTVIFVTVAFAGLVSSRVLLLMVLVQYAWKLAFEIAMTPFTYRVVAWLKAKEGVDVYDRGISYRIV